MKIPYPANIYVMNALRTAIAELERTIKTCGELVHPETKLTQDAKSYFEKQGNEAKEIISKLNDQIRAIEL